MPSKLKLKGNHLILKLSHSVSIKKLWPGNVNIEPFQKSLPKPTNKSLNKQPQNKLPTPSISKGKIIRRLDPCIEFTKTLLELQLFKKVK